MYVDNRIGLGIKVKRCKADENFEDIIRSVSDKEMLKSFLDGFSFSNFLDSNGLFINVVIETSETIDGTYIGSFYLCVTKETSKVSNFPLVLTKESLNNWDKEESSLEYICNQIGIPFNKDELAVIIDTKEF